MVFGGGYSDRRPARRKSRPPVLGERHRDLDRFEKDSVVPTGGRTPSILPQGRQKASGESMKPPTPMNTRELLLVNGRIIGALPETAEAVKKAFKHGVAVSPAVLDRLKETQGRAFGEPMAPEPPAQASGARALDQLTKAGPNRRRAGEPSQSEPIIGELTLSDKRTIRDIAWACGTISAEVRRAGASELRRLEELGVTKERVGLMNQLAGMLGPLGSVDYAEALSIIQKLRVKGNGLQAKFGMLDRLYYSISYDKPLSESPFES